VRASVSLLYEVSEVNDMSGWKVTGKREDPGEVVLDIATAGIKPILENMLGVERDKIYTVENKETGEVRHVTASNSTRLGERIAEGKFDKE
jgi:hypothetical protein